MRIFITGIAGFIGSHLADALVARGHEVSGIDDLSTGRADNVSVPFTIGDVRTEDLGSGWDLIYHCAASYKDREAWERDASVNVLGTINVVRAAQRSKARLVYFQTSLCYGPNPPSPVKLTAQLAPVGSYAVSKTAAESYIRDSGVEYVSLRLANIYGPRNLSGPIPTFYQRITEGKPCIVVESRRDFVYVDDLVRVATEAGVHGEGIYHVGSGRDRSIAEVYGEVAHALHSDAIPEYRQRGPDDVATILLDASRTSEEFRWAPAVPLSVGIPRAVRWYRDHGVTETFTHLAQR